MIEADSVISPSMTDREAAELAYGLLWMVGCDRSTKVGEALYLARQSALREVGSRWTSAWDHGCTRGARYRPHPPWRAFRHLPTQSLASAPE